MICGDKYEYQYDKERNVLFKKYFGSITLADIADSWDAVIDQGLIPKYVVGFVLDYLDATFDFDLENHVNIPLYYQKHLSIFEGKKIGVVTVNPKDIVVPILVEKLDDGYRSRAFSTISAATQWVALK